MSKQQQWESCETAATGTGDITQVMWPRRGLWVQLGQRVWLTASGEAEGCMASRTKALWCHQPWPTRWLLAAGTGVGGEPIRQPDPR